MLSEKNAAVVANLFYTLDIGVRDQLAKRLITSERDYVSALAHNFRHPFGLFNNYVVGDLKFEATWTARSNDGSSEQAFGCDSMIVFQVKDKVKVCLFEAKWPRVVIDSTYSWDSLQKSSKKSHFTDQINRQAEWANEAAIWEMFFLEERPNTIKKPFDKYGSTCVKHKFAKAYIDGPHVPSTIWDNTDLERLINSSLTDAYTGIGQSNLHELIIDVLTCKFGQAIEIEPSDSFFELTSASGKQVRVPVPNLGLSENRPFILEEFMGEYGLSFFQYMNISQKEDGKAPTE
jgi:hypothetical protein